MNRHLLLRWRLWLGVVLLILAQASNAQAISLDDLPTAPLGRSIGLLVEKDKALSLPEAQALQRQGLFRPADTDVPKFGIGAKPVWLHLNVRNNTGAPVQRRLLVEPSWLDRVDLYQLQGDRLTRQWAAGDGNAQLQHPRPGLGYIFDHTFPPGESTLFLRIETPDPMVLPIRLLSPAQTELVLHQYDYGYGLLYGFLLALIAYNATLYVGLRQRSHLDYSLYLGSFVLLNLAYTGHGYAWIWPQHTNFQQFVILVLMVLVGCFGFRFASSFLDLRQHAPRVYRAVRGFALVGLVLIALATLLRHQESAVLIAFVFILLYSAGMVWLGAVSIQQGRIAGRYFLIAALVALLGTSTTALAVWHGLPYSPLAFHAAGWSIAIEGTLLALALANQVRQHQQARMEAEQLARLDSLTGLLNRRAFLERAEPAWSIAMRNQRPLAMIMADLDFFKRINDNHGHAMGDQALTAVGRILGEACRGGDIAARWGGEEFILLLPETDADQAIALAERLRGQVSALTLGKGQQKLSLSASFGVAELHDQPNLEELIRESDEWLYHAKKNGRNRVGARSLNQ